MDMIMNFFEAFPVWLTAITALVASASGIAALTPTPKDDAIFAKLYSVLDFLALNFGKAKDKGDE